jgi:aminopeptidase N
MTLHQLRLAVGDGDFFRILRRWATSREGDNVTTDEFIGLAERVSGEELSALFDTWLFTATKPELATALDAQRAASSSSGRPLEARTGRLAGKSARVGVHR